MSQLPKGHLDRFNCFPGLTKVTNRHTDTDRQTHIQSDHTSPSAAIARVIRNAECDAAPKLNVSTQHNKNVSDTCNGESAYHEKPPFEQR